MIVRLRTARWLAPFRPRSLSATRAYRVLSISGDSLRLLSGDEERDGPYLYDRRFFDVIDATEPEDWSVEFGEGGERYAEPQEFEKYTWEDYFDGNVDAVARVTAYIDRVSPCFYEIPDATDSYGPRTRRGAIDRLQLLATPESQVAAGTRLAFWDMTTAVLFALADVAPIDLRSNAEDDAIQNVRNLADQISCDLFDSLSRTDGGKPHDDPPPPISEFVKTPQSEQLAAAAVNALQVFFPESYMRILGKPTDRSPVPPNSEDIARARVLSTSECPRRYCWWWHSWGFDWKMAISEGCTYLESEYADSPDSPGRFTPCTRNDTSSCDDHYEKREDVLEEDGFVEDHFRT